jgi:hypothetical protein
MVKFSSKLEMKKKIIKKTSKAKAFGFFDVTNSSSSMLLKLLVWTNWLIICSIYFRQPIIRRIIKILWSTEWSLKGTVGRYFLAWFFCRGSTRYVPQISRLKRFYVLFRFRTVIRIFRENEKEQKILLASKSGAHIEWIHDKKTRPKNLALLYL